MSWFEEWGWIIVVIPGVYWIFQIIVGGIKQYKIDKLIDEKLSRINMEYLKTTLNSLGLNIERCITFSSIINPLEKNNFNTFIVDNTKKEFGIAHYTIDVKSLNKSLKKVPNDIIKTYSINDTSFFECVKPFISIVLDNKHSYNDLVKYEILDKTTVDKERTFITESNQMEVLTSAAIGDAIGNPINGAIVGAMVGNAGEKRVHEKVNTTTNVAFDVVLTLNKFDTPSISLTTDNEQSLREIAGTLDFILNNK